MKNAVDNLRAKIVVIIMLIACAAVYGGQTGKVSGRVLDSETKEPVVGANIVIERTYLGAAADYVLLDLGTGLAEPARHILPICHQIIVTIEPQRMALTLAQSLLVEMTQSLEIPNHKIGLVMVNKAPSGATFTKDAIAGLLLRELIGIVTPAPDVAFQSGERGIPMVMIDPDSLVARQFRNIAEHLAMANV